MKKTWFLFYVIAFAGLFTLATTLYLKHNDVLTKVKTEQQYITKNFDSYISSTFFQFETILDLISYEFTLQKTLQLNVIDRILSRSPLIVGFALFNTDGTLNTASKSLQSIDFPNMLTNPNTRRWFAKNLTQDAMTIGKAYYLPPLEKWVIPIRKRIRNSQGEVIGVIASGLDLQAFSEQWVDDSHGKREFQIVIDDPGADSYRILRSDASLIDYSAIYDLPIDAARIATISALLAQKNISLDELRRTAEPAQIILNRGEKTVYSTILFNKKQQLWVSTIEESDAVYQQLYPQLAAYSSFYLLFLMIIYLLFKWIVHIEKNKITELTYRAEHDILTGLYNRSVLTNQEQQKHKHNKPFALLYIDLDHFKGINDSYGYTYGDIILTQVSERIRSCLKTIPNTAIRLSADEFVVILNTIDRKLIEQYCSALLTSIAQPYIINNNDFKISASIGIAKNPKDATGIETLISYANNSMLIAKKNKNQYIFFSEKIHQQLIKNIEIEQALHSAINKNEISLVYQPQFDNHKNLIGVEALVRWQHSELGMIPPDQFIPIAENTGFMPELGSFIMNQAMLEISQLQNLRKCAFQLSINVSARQFIQRNFFATLIEYMDLYQSPYLKITIEITESLFIENIERLLPVFEKMKAANISLSLDDFGTGYSSLSMLRNVPIDELKIDKSFVDHIVDNLNDQAMVSSIITMGKNMGMTVLAEGVENQEQASILQNAGCDIYQGYYFSKPLNLSALENFIDAL